MKTHRRRSLRLASLIIAVIALTFVSTRLKADTGTCGGEMITLPFSDVAASNIFFCSIAEAFFSGLTNGTSGTTYSPSDPVPREQMAAFVSRTLDQSVKRGNPRAALGEWWTNQTTRLRDPVALGGHNPRFLACDGQTLWVSLTESNLVQRIDIRTNMVICTISGITSPEQIVVVGDAILIASAVAPGKLHQVGKSTTIDKVSSPLFTVGDNPIGITFDGTYLWTANDTGSVSRVDCSPGAGGALTTFNIGFNQPRGILFDGANLWVADAGDSSLKRVDRSTGAVLQTVALSGSVQHPVFDGTNLWIPCTGPDKVFVVRGVGLLTGTVLATLTGNGLDGPFQAAFDGERICVTNANSKSVSLWKATDLSPITSVSVEQTSFYNVRGICSDGTSFFIGLRYQFGSQDLVVRQ